MRLSQICFINLSGLLVMACVVLLIPQYLHAQEVTTSDGKVWTTSSLRRSGNLIMLKVSLDGSGTVEMGLPIARITRISFPEPPELSKALAAASAGNAPDVLSLTDNYVSTQGGFKDVVGSWWPEMARLRLLALVATEKYADAASLAREIGALNNPNDLSLARGGTLFAPLVSGDTEAVVVGAKSLPRLGGGDGSALAQLALGQALLLKKNYAGAIRAFLTIKVFYPSLTLLQPAALLGAANAYLGLKDTKRENQTLKDIEELFPDSIQSTKAKKMETDPSKS